MHKLCFVKNFCSTKDIKRLRRQATDGKKIYAKHTSIKDHYKNKYKQYLKLNNKEIARLKNRPKSLTGPPAVQEGSLFSTPPPAFGIWTY